MPVSVPMHLSPPPLLPLSVGAASAALRRPSRDLLGAAHLRRATLVLATLALAGFGIVVSDRSARPNGPLVWHAAPVARQAMPEAAR